MVCALNLSAQESIAKNRDKREKMQEKQVLVKKENLAVYDKVSDKIFAGGLPKVTLLFAATPYANAGAALVHFPRGVRTAWHTHPAGQNLIVTQGKIYTGTADGIIQIARPGDVVLCPPDVKHWHGAGLHEDGEHIAVTFEKDGKNVTWLEHLSEDEYENFVKLANERENDI